ncbi:MAG TPA: glycoside hydrolase, partial [Verrucomicrobia subdivision 3 bacterium]|nr:glycoside hydrolase [Limisphaerales bacterium]
MKKLIALVTALNFAAAVLAADKVPLNVRDFGAKGDGVTKDTVALQKALDTCAENVGSTVLVPEGVYLTGSLILHANTTLQLATRANLLGSPD